MNLFLDDQRNPKDAYIYPRRDDNNMIIEGRSLENISQIPRNNWEIVRSYEEFVKFIIEKGIPDVVSFDHDLTPECINLYFDDTINTGIIEYANLPKRTGWHCAKFLKEKCIELNIPFPKYFVHSANIYGSKNITELIEND